MQRNQAEPEAIAAFQDEHHLVALADAQVAQIIRHFIAVVFDLREGEGGLLARFIAPYQRGTIGEVLCQLVNDIVGEVEVFRHVDAEIGEKLVVRTKSRLRKILLKH